MRWDEMDSSLLHYLFINAALAKLAVGQNWNARELVQLLWFEWGTFSLTWSSFQWPGALLSARFEIHPVEVLPRVPVPTRDSQYCPAAGPAREDEEIYRKMLLVNIVGGRFVIPRNAGQSGTVDNLVNSRLLAPWKKAEQRRVKASQRFGAYGGHPWDGQPLFSLLRLKFSTMISIISRLVKTLVGVTFLSCHEEIQLQLMWLHWCRSLKVP